MITMKQFVVSICIFDEWLLICFYALKVLTTLTTYCLQMGHSAICLPQLVQVHM